MECMWLILQQDTHEDFVIATGEQHSVREFCYEAFKAVGIDLEFKGEGANEIGVDKSTGRILIEVSSDFYRVYGCGEFVGRPNKGKAKIRLGSSKDDLV